MENSHPPKTVAEAAQALGVSIHTIRAWIAQLRICYLKLGRAVRIPQTEIDRILLAAIVPPIPSENRLDGKGMAG